MIITKMPKLEMIELPSLDLELLSLDLDVQPLELEPLPVLDTLPLVVLEPFDIPKLIFEPVQFDLEPSMLTA